MASKYDKEHMSDADYEQVAKYTRDFEIAQASGDQAGMDAAHKNAEAVRAKYQYTGGKDGSDVYSWGDNGIGSGLEKDSGSGKGGGGAFSYGSAPSYTNKYQGMIDSLTQQILGREKFSYDAESDPGYQQYREQYTREGERAMKDTLGEVSARTGGLASSYATSAAAQANDYYMQQLSDKIPELRQLAYSMYLDEGNRMRDDLSMLTALEQGDYAKYADLLAQYNTDRAFDYGVYRDGVSDSRYDTEWKYQAGRDQIADQRYEREYGDRRGDVQYERDYDRALTLAAAGSYSGLASLWGLSEEETGALVEQYARQKQTTEEQAARDLADWHAQYGDFSRLKQMGVDTSYLSRMQNAELSSRYRSSSDGKSSKDSGDGGEADYDGLFSDAYASGNPSSYISNNYKKYGFTNVSGLTKDYENWVKAADKGPGYDSVWMNARRKYDNGATTGEIVNYLVERAQAGQISVFGQEYILDRLGLDK